jgi:hypothetical protein
VRELYPDDEHVFIFDNARTHSKLAKDALSARHMPKNTSKPEKNWMLKRAKCGEDGKPIYDEKGKKVEEPIRMHDAMFNGQPQPLYFAANHPTHPNLFKGTAAILEERGYLNAHSLKSECNKNFKCSKNSDGEYGDCCCWRILFNQPDFVNVPSLPFTLCESYGILCLFLPKFHPELNFIEQCWGYAKCVYREFPPSSLLEDLEKNAKAALDVVPLMSMRR